MLAHDHSGSLAAIVLTLIERHPEGLHLEEVRSRVRWGGHRPRVDDVAAALLDLQRAGLTRIGPMRRWFSYSIPTPFTARYSGDREPLDSAGHVHPTGGPVLVAIPATIGVPGSASPVAPALASAGDRLEPSWALLRRLLPYYREALARNERALLLGDTSRYGEQFLFLAPCGRWWAGEGEHATLEIARSVLPPAFLTALARRAREPIHVAFPIALVRPSDETRPPFLVPVATVATEWALDAETLRLTLPAETPAIEWSWVRGQRQRGRRVRELLDALDISADDEVWQTGSFVDWRTFNERLAGAVPTELRTPLDTAQPVRALDCGGSAGIYGALALFLSSDLQFARRTVRDLLDLAQWSDEELARTALAAFFGGATGNEAGAEPPVPVLESLALGEDQLRAVRDGLNRPLTVVTGPPGTGKSQVAVALMASAALAGRSVLFASRNHQAIDAVVDRFAEQVERRPLLIRANTRDGGEGFNFERAIDAILARPGVSGRRERLAASFDALARLDAARATAIERANDAAEQADELGQIEAAICDLETVIGLDGTVTAPLPTPLPPSGNRAAHGGLRLFAPWLRFWRLWRLRRLPIDWTRLGLAEPDETTLELHEQRLDDLRRLERLRDERSRIEADIRRRQATDEGPDPIALGEQIQASARARLLELTEVLAECAPENRSALTALRGDLALTRSEGAAGAARARERWSAQRGLILDQFPLWAASNLGAASRIPLVPGLFDYVVLDEAAQCDIASVLPLLARARRAIIIGDPAQLTHITQVRPEWEAEALRAAGLRVPGIGSFTFSANSLFHFAAAAAGDHHLLRDHFRCHDDIADYISETFYGHRLRPLTDARALRPPAGKTAGFHWTEVSGPIQPARTGCWAPVEIEAIVAELSRLLTPGGFDGSIGVVTPFREQANRLRDQVERVLPVDQIARARLEVHTAHGFQGDARDVMLFSLCVGPDMPERARQFLRETGNLVNVAVSRARAICHVFGDLDYAAQCGIPYLEMLLARRQQRRETPTARFDSPWEERLWRALAARGIETIPQYPIAGRRLDLALIRGEQRIDIEVDGDWFHRDPDGRRKMADLWRDHQLRALGWNVVRFWVYELRENMNACVERVLTKL
ncbi:MAG: AAA domain-containing protein [Candidatus Contendobacter sp.]